MDCGCRAPTTPGRTQCAPTLSCLKNLGTAWVIITLYNQWIVDAVPLLTPGRTQCAPTPSCLKNLGTAWVIITLYNQWIVDAVPLPLLGARNAPLHHHSFTPSLLHSLTPSLLHSSSPLLPLPIVS